MRQAAQSHFVSSSPWDLVGRDSCASLISDVGGDYPQGLVLPVIVLVSSVTIERRIGRPNSITTAYPARDQLRVW